jgi:flagellar biosynthesis/type III secretory pathway M-ring protein FliF/YscJ
MLGLIAVSGLLAVGYWASTSISPAGVRYISPGRKLSSEDLIRICRSLDEQRIDYHQEEHRIEVGADQFDQAAAIVAKLDLGQHPIDELRNQSSTWSFVWETSDERNRKNQLAKEKILESLISRLDGVVWSLVSMRQVQDSAAVRSPQKPSAFVYLETEGGRQLPFRTVQSILTILTGYEPGLTLKATTVMDRRGHTYLYAGNPALGHISSYRVQEEELTEKILERLNWIKGVRVLVQVSIHKISETTQTRIGASAAYNRMNHEARQPSNTTSARVPSIRFGFPNVPVRVNQPLDLEGETNSPHGKLRGASDVSDTAGHLSGDGLEDEEVRQPGLSSDGGRILVNVPRSFYYNALINKVDHRGPSADDLRIIAARTEEQIKRTVNVLVTRPAMWDVHVDTIPDDVPMSRPSLPSGSPGRTMLNWGVVGVVGAVCSVLLAVAVMWIQVARRSGKDPVTAARKIRTRAPSTSEAGPTERVRELVRLDPEAAASVLRRWTAQGGGIS